MELIRASNRENYKKANATRQHSEIDSSEHISSQDDNISVSLQNPIKTVKSKSISLTHASPPKRRDLRLHPHAVRTGDYYMFEEYNDIDEPNLYEEYDFLEKEDTRQMLIYSKKKLDHGPSHGSSGNINDYSSDSEIDFETHPIIKLTAELIMLVTFRLNRLSRNYRFVHKVLSAEKKTLQDISTMNRLGLVNTAAMFSFLNQSLYDKQLDAINTPPKESTFDLISKSEDFTTLNHNNFVQMLISLWYAIIANTEVVSYLAVFVNQAANSSIISLPMPFLVLYWGALTLPRPTKNFWVTLITYTLAMIFLKCIMHQKIVLDPKLIKLAKTTDFELFSKHGKAVYDLLLLVVLFWHRYMLKKQGIWNIPRSETDPVPLNQTNSKTLSKERPTDILKRLREESGSEPKETTAYRSNTSEMERDIDDLLRPGMENKYVYHNIESENYRFAMKSLDLIKKD
ncbi:piezo-type mechanosensitive ion channel component-like isoform X2 [Drosophila montana]|uniref:piezo-type mechanosensitive ion channel component-like n=1 Tax=Drosophila montana TaxID=40370 RepID=UPI00313A8104